ncbi:unnamed protein product [Rhizoctonia solani]|uniref:Uncharacterized protein n=1 Tax=Rhizoctonia solani TaxID=456999 RepID=A0A8H3B3M2_9AGAM|nr:unnamed protein product [Rhizoctonia solani]
MTDSKSAPTFSRRKQTRKPSEDLDDFEEESGRASRARTKLIVEGFSNLALIATFFAGVQAQLLSDTNDDNIGALSIATSAAFFGGLIFSVFTAILATCDIRKMVLHPSGGRRGLSVKSMACPRLQAKGG